MRINVQRHLTRLGHRCDVVAPSLVPSRSVWKFGLASPPMMRISGQAARSMH